MCSRCRQVTKEVDREKGKKLGRGLLRPDALNTREREERNRVMKLKLNDIITVIILLCFREEINAVNDGMAVVIYFFSAMKI